MMWFWRFARMIGREIYRAIDPFALCGDIVFGGRHRLPNWKPAAAFQAHI